MILLNYPRQGEQPNTIANDILVEHDVKFLVSYLEFSWKTSLVLNKKPDEEIRRTAQPDYLFNDIHTGKQIVIEHTRLFETEKIRKQEATKTKALEAQGYAAMWKITNNMTSSELGSRISDYITTKLGKNQFRDWSNAERILLIRSGITQMRPERFIDATPFFLLPKNINCDRCYLISYRQLIEVF